LPRGEEGRGQGQRVEACRYGGSGEAVGHGLGQAGGHGGRLVGKTALAAALAAAIAACDETSLGPDPAAPPPSDVEAALAHLREIERATVEAARSAEPPFELGPDPTRIASHGGRLFGILRGRDALVEIDVRGTEIARVPTVPSPAGLAVCDDGSAWISSGLDASLRRVSIGDGSPRAAGARPIPAAGALGDVACGPDGTVYVADRRSDVVHVVRRDGVEAAPACRGPIRLERIGDRLLVACLVDHALVAYRLDARGMPAGEETRAVHDGPIWGFAARPEGDDLVVAIGGIEDHPLDRRDGFFGFIDSYLFVYRFASGSAARLTALDLSESGVVTPKTLRWLDRDRLLVAGYGGERSAVVTIGAEPRVEPAPLPPGTSDAAFAGDTVLFADPLLDAWVVAPPGGEPLVVPVPDDRPRDARARLGEVLVFTELMAPRNPTDGPRSRFSCEACHFEGGVDGRTHHTGRGDVRATTKPLFGLLRNGPHFTRALDPDLTTVSHAEFRVAGAGSPLDPWFELPLDGRPWLRPLAADGAGPAALREAVLRFLMGYAHAPNPAAWRKKGGRFDETEARGAAVFRDRCAGCHAPRIVARDAATAVPYEAWEDEVLGPGRVVWASEGYHATGVEPYVHPEGARTTSLRRLHEKRPYFTNGSAKTLAEVVERARFEGERFWHDGAPAAAAALDAADRAALLAFLRLL
jgi:hypothetical protein